MLLGIWEKLWRTAVALSGLYKNQPPPLPTDSPTFLHNLANMTAAVALRMNAGGSPNSKPNPDPNPPAERAGRRAAAAALRTLGAHAGGAHERQGGVRPGFGSERAEAQIGGDGNGAGYHTKGAHTITRLVCIGI